MTNPLNFLDSQIRPDGTGGIRFGNDAIIRGTSSVVRAPHGLFIYLRDLDRRVFWSATPRPIAPLPDGHCIFQQDRSSAGAVFTRTEYGIRAELRVFVLQQYPVDVRLIRVTNESDVIRTIELSSYGELVLQREEAFESHPVFSKLFLETEYLTATQQLVARRRTRAPEERTVRAAAWIVRDGQRPAAEIQFETDRVRFIGRGRTLANPRAMTSTEPLTGTVGGVLDPIFALRTTVTVHPGSSQEVAFVCAASYEIAELAALAELVTLGQIVEQAQLLNFDEPQQGRVSNSFESHASRLKTSFESKNIYQSAGTHVAVPYERSPLVMFNGTGGFRQDGREYVIELQPDATGELCLPPRPWSHIVANPSCGFIATERGAICSWAHNSRENRLTPWSNDAVSDPWLEQCYFRDRQSRTFWSPFPAPVSDGCRCTVRYGYGYARYEKTCQELVHETSIFVPIDDPLRIIQLTVTNPTDRERRLELLTCHPWVLGNGLESNDSRIETHWDAHHQAIFASRLSRSSYSHHCAFSTLIADDGSPIVDFTSDLDAFVGATGEMEAPLAVQHDLELHGEVGTPAAPGAAMRISFVVPPHGTVRLWHILGEADSADASHSLVDRYRDPTLLASQLDQITAYWANLLGKLQVETPSPALDLLLNGWLVYQNVVCRLWGRSSYYQGGGAIGFRDQLQDACALKLHRPDWTRQQILLHGEHQFPGGDVLHWWHPDDGPGLRTRFSDDLLWLPFAALDYVDSTGDDIWDEPLAFCLGEDLAPGEQEKLMTTRTSTEKATLYEHCCLALERSRAVGEHGLPLIGCGDWNDGFSRVGAAGRGESVWLACFLCFLLPRFAKVCLSRGDGQRSARYQEWHAELLTAIEQHGWDGNWYRRAYLDNGEPLGSVANDECRIDALVQAWAILAGVATGDRASAIVQQVQQNLVDERAGIIRLLTPAFDSEQRDVGYIRGYIAGVRENGGQYTHGILWFIRALAEIGHADDAVHLLEMITPINHSSSAERVAVYGAEPYVVAADIYGEPPHTGKAGWTWYTGSAGWMYRVAIESILGLRITDGKWLRLKPCLPNAWPGFRMTYILPDSAGSYEIHVRRADRHRALLDGKPIEITDGTVLIPIDRVGGVHRVEIEWSRR